MVISHQQRSPLLSVVQPFTLKPRIIIIIGFTSRYKTGNGPFAYQTYTVKMANTTLSQMLLIFKSNTSLSVIARVRPLPSRPQNRHCKSTIIVYQFKLYLRHLDMQQRLYLPLGYAIFRSIRSISSKNRITSQNRNKKPGTWLLFIKVRSSLLQQLVPKIAKGAASSSTTPPIALQYYTIIQLNKRTDFSISGLSESLISIILSSAPNRIIEARLYKNDIFPHASSTSHRRVCTGNISAQFLHLKQLPDYIILMTST